MTPEVYKACQKIRYTEESLLELFTQGKMNGTIHTCVGQELASYYLIKYLNKDDYIFSNHRCHGHYLHRFAIKEAIFKATNGLCGNDFSKVEIEKKSDGSIVNDLCSISISYLNSQEKEICVAVAVATNKNFIDSKSIKPSDSIEDPFSKVSNKSIENNTKCGKDNLLWIGFILLLAYILIRDIGITLN